MGPARGGSPAPVAKTGYCGFATTGRVSSLDMDDHVQFLLDELEKKLDSVKEIVVRCGLKWCITCFYDSVSDEPSQDTVGQRNLARAQAFGIPVVTSSD